jgi:hypothetical protein
MIDGFRFPRFDREDFMNFGPGGRIQLGMLAASPVTVNRRQPPEAKGLALQSRDRAKSRGPQQEPQTHFDHDRAHQE